MTLRFAPALAAVSLGMLALAASAQYKVIGPDGKVTYTDQPPAEGTAKVQTLRVGGGGEPSGNGINAALLPPGLRIPATRYPVTLYTAGGCGPCDSGRALLTQRGIPFVEKRAETGDDLAALAKLTGGSRALPLLVVGSQQVRSLSTSEWQATLDAAGYPSTSLLPPSFKRPAPTSISAVDSTKGQDGKATLGSRSAPRSAGVPAPAPAPVEAETTASPPLQTPTDPGNPGIRF
jgi:glutaredoxin